MKKIKVVIDTSVFISAILGDPNATPAKVLASMFHNEFENYSSDDSLEELYHVLFSKKIMNYFRNRPEFLAWTFLLINGITKRVKPETKLNICRDSQDNMFLEIAYESKAKYIITLDTDLLDLRDKSDETIILNHHVKILRPDEFIRELAHLKTS